MPCGYALLLHQRKRDLWEISDIIQRDKTIFIMLLFLCSVL